jgi:hypothetical protein
MLSQDVWFRQQSLQQLWQGPAASAAYVGSAQETEIYVRVAVPEIIPLK